MFRWNIVEEIVKKFIQHLECRQAPGLEYESKHLQRLPRKIGVQTEVLSTVSKPSIAKNSSFTYKSHR